MLAIDKQNAAFVDHRRNQQPDHHSGSKEWHVFAKGLLPQSDAYGAHDGNENRKADCAPERTDDRATVATFDFHEAEAAPQIITLQSVKKVFRTGRHKQAKMPAADCVRLRYLVRHVFSTQMRLYSCARCDYFVATAIARAATERRLWLVIRLSNQARARAPNPNG